MISRDGVKFYNVAETATFLQVTQGYVRLLISNGKLPAMQLGKKMLYVSEANILARQQHTPDPNDLRPYVPQKMRRTV